MNKLVRRGLVETHPNRQAFTLTCIEKEDGAKNAHTEKEKNR